MEGKLLQCPVGGKWQSSIRAQNSLTWEPIFFATNIQVDPQMPEGRQQWESNKPDQGTPARKGLTNRLESVTE